MFFQTKNKAECSGCTACEKSCPVQAIKFKIDDEGFNYPFIDDTICINCGLCERVCPVANPRYDNAENPDVYAAILKDESQRVKSTSGGLFYAIAMWVIRRGGIVFGATIDEHNQVRHISAENEGELQALRGSKYVQSALNDTFKLVEKNLHQGRICYFVGTGCQVAGLNAYLRKKYDKLITSDLVCHGVPSQWLFDQHISYLKDRHKGEIVDYYFRNNEKGAGGELFTVVNRKGKRTKICNPTYNISPYLYSFMYGMTSRYSCYECKFAKIPRQGDITLADFWGVKEFFPEMDNSKGISLCLVNSDHGKMIWDANKCDLDYRESKITDASKRNVNLIQTATMHPNRPYIYKMIKDEGYAIVTKKEFRIAHYNRLLFKTWVSDIPPLANLMRYILKVKRLLS